MVSWVVGFGGRGRVEVYDVQGRMAAELMSGWMGPGTHSALWSLAGIRAGIYFAVLTTEKAASMKRFVILGDR